MYRDVHEHRAAKLDTARRSLSVTEQSIDIYGEFDPGSGRTLAACLTHASRTDFISGSFRMEANKVSGGRVSNAWVTCP